MPTLNGQTPLLTLPVGLPSVCTIQPTAPGSADTLNRRCVTRRRPGLFLEPFRLRTP
jgi:hypothetical protein